MVFRLDMVGVSRRVKGSFGYALCGVPTALGADRDQGWIVKRLRPIVALGLVAMALVTCDGSAIAQGTADGLCFWAATIVPAVGLAIMALRGIL